MKTLVLAVAVLVPSVCLPSDGPPSADAAARKLIDRLGGATRDLADPVDLGGATHDPAKKQVLIYYANDTAPDEAFRKALDAALSRLDASPHPEVAALAERIRHDHARFPEVVDAELAALKAAWTKVPPAERPGLLAVTNRSARAGRLEYARPGSEEFLAADFTPPVSESSVARSYPLAGPAALPAVLDEAVGLFAPDAHEFVLVTKSHGTAEHVLIPYVAIDVARLEVADAVAEMERAAARRFEEFRKTARPILGGDGAPVRDEAGRGLYEGGGEIRAEGRGRLVLTVHGDAVVLADVRGAPFRTADGSAVLLDGDTFRLESSPTPLATGDGTAARVAYLEGAQDSAVRPGELGAAELRRVLAERPLPPVVATGGLVTRQVEDAGSPLSPEDNSTLSPDDNSTLSPEDNSTLSPEDNSTLSPEDNSTLGAGFASPLISKAGGVAGPIHATTKEQYVAALLAARDRGMRFPVVFLESCKSELESERLSPLKSDAAGLGYVWTSDRRGLRLTTLDYEQVFAGVAAGQALSESIHDALREARRAQWTSRERVGTQQVDR